jgi:hypothetical protein
MMVAGETAQQKIAQLTAVKSKPGSADLMRKLYVKDLTPIEFNLAAQEWWLTYAARQATNHLSLHDLRCHCCSQERQNC